jgi:hypothetical protein
LCLSSINRNDRFGLSKKIFRLAQQDIDLRIRAV